ncbi:MAG: hypothetical protein LBQ83_00570 [Candidatus Margulisbacteria bacterium]|jgi:hypothetical protein|nr:hypothetical protein [Candidatus Margulisiibacteriota bacterium]
MSFFTDNLPTAEMFAKENSYIVLVNGDPIIASKQDAENIQQIIEPYEDLEWGTGWDLWENADEAKREDLQDFLETYLSFSGNINSLEIIAPKEVIYDVFLNIRNPGMKDYGGRTWGEQDVHIEADLRKALDRDKKTDGFIARNIIEGGLGAEINGEAPPIQNTYITLHHNQIKSATDNSGEFSADNPDIRYQRTDFDETHPELVDKPDDYTITSFTVNAKIKNLPFKFTKLILDKKGLFHADKHISEIRTISEPKFKNTKDFINFVVVNTDKIYKGKYPNTYLFVTEQIKPRGLAATNAVEIDLGKYRISTALPVRKSQYKNMTPLWERAANAPKLFVLTDFGINKQSGAATKVASRDNDSIPQSRENIPGKRYQRDGERKAAAIDLDDKDIRDVKRLYQRITDDEYIGELEAQYDRTFTPQEKVQILEKRKRLSKLIDAPSLEFTGNEWQGKKEEIVLILENHNISLAGQNLINNNNDWMPESAIAFREKPGRKKEQRDLDAKRNVALDKAKVYKTNYAVNVGGAYLWENLPKETRPYSAYNHPFVLPEKYKENRYIYDEYDALFGNIFFENKPEYENFKRDYSSVIKKDIGEVREWHHDKTTGGKTFFVSKKGLEDAGFIFDDKSDDKSSDIALVKKYALKNFNKKYFTNADGEKVLIDRDSIDKITSHGRHRGQHINSIFYIPELIKNSTFIDEDVNRKGTKKYHSYRYYVTGLEIGGVPYTAKLVIGVRDGKNYYDHDLTQIEKGHLLVSVTNGREMTLSGNLAENSKQDANAELDPNNQNQISQPDIKDTTLLKAVNPLPIDIVNNTQKLADNARYDKGRSNQNNGYDAGFEAGKKDAVEGRGFGEETEFLALGFSEEFVIGYNDGYNTSLENSPLYQRNNPPLEGKELPKNLTPRETAQEIMKNSGEFEPPAEDTQAGPEPGTGTEDTEESAESGDKRRFQEPDWGEAGPDEELAPGAMDFDFKDEEDLIGAVLPEEMEDAEREAAEKEIRAELDEDRQEHAAALEAQSDAAEAQKYGYGTRVLIFVL